METNGGIQRVLYNVVDGLLDYHDVTICTYMKETSKPYYQYNRDVHFVFLDEYFYRRDIISRGIRYITRRFGVMILPKTVLRLFYDKKNISRLQKVLDSGKYDVVIALQGTYTMLLAQVDKKNINNTRFYGWMHSSFEAYFETPFEYNYGEKKLAQKLLKNLNAIVALTEHDAKKYCDSFGVDSTCIYNPLSFAPEQRYNPESKQLIFVGRLLENTKGIDYLLNILENVFKLKEFNEYSCLIVGEGPDFEKIIQLVQEKKLEKNVFLLGNRNDVKELISDSVVLLSTSRWEGFGMSIIEAFSCGVPVISFDNSGPNEIIDNGKNGEIIKRFDINAFRDAIIGFLSDREKRIRYSTCAFNSTQRFKKENIIKKWNDLLS